MLIPEFLFAQNNNFLEYLVKYGVTHNGQESVEFFGLNKSGYLVNFLADFKVEVVNDYDLALVGILSKQRDNKEYIIFNH